MDGGGRGAIRPVSSYCSGLRVRDGSGLEKAAGEGGERLLGRRAGAHGLNHVEHDQIRGAEAHTGEIAQRSQSGFV